jgi:hypothetical protein
MEDPDMIDGLEEIRSAVDALATRDERLKSRLSTAGKRFWSATYHLDEWPSRIQKRAESIQRTILARGSVQATVAEMTLEEAEEVAEQILELLLDLQKATEDRQRVSGPSDVPT